MTGLIGGLAASAITRQKKAAAHCRLMGQQAVPAKLNKTINNSFGFGAVNTRLILKRGNI